MRVYKSIIIHTRIYFRFEDGASVCSFVSHHREVGARLFHEMELELVSLPCQTVNSLGAATRAINPLLVLQFSTQPRTAINNRPLSKVDHNPRRFLVDFQKFHRSPSVALLFFSLSLSLSTFFSLLRGRKAFPDIDNNEKGNFRGFDRGEKEIGVL